MALATIWSWWDTESSHGLRGVEFYSSNIVTSKVMSGISITPCGHRLSVFKSILVRPKRVLSGHFDSIKRSINEL